MFANVRFRYLLNKAAHKERAAMPLHRYQRETGPSVTSNVLCITFMTVSGTAPHVASAKKTYNHRNTVPIGRKFDFL